MDMLKNKEFWLGVGFAIVLIKFGPGLPVIGPAVTKLKA
jgi:hypothetical protein